MTVKTRLTQARTDNRNDDAPVVSDNLAVVLGALYDLNRHRDADTLAQKIVSVMPRAIACDTAIFARIEPAGPSFTFASWPSDRFAGVDHNDAARLHLQDHPLVAHLSARRNGA